MSKTNTTEPVYRSVMLPGLGRVEIPEGVSEEDVLAQVLGGDSDATPPRKTKKKT